MTGPHTEPTADSDRRVAGAGRRPRTDGGVDSDHESTPDANDGVPDASVREAGESYVNLTGGTYIESTIIMTTVRVVAPFVMTFGLFITFHGADSPGGGFQGGVILASVLVMIAIAYGTAPTRDWISAPGIGGLISGGVLLFALIGVGTLALGGNFLEYVLYGGATASKYGIELVELGISATVVGTVTSIFFVLSRGFDVENGGESE